MLLQPRHDDSPAVRLRRDRPAAARAQHERHARRGPVHVTVHLRRGRALATPAAAPAVRAPQVSGAVLCERKIEKKYIYLALLLIHTENDNLLMIKWIGQKLSKRCAIKACCNTIIK